MDNFKGFQECIRGVSSKFHVFLGCLNDVLFLTVCFEEVTRCSKEVQEPFWQVSRWSQTCVKDISIQVAFYVYCLPVHHELLLLSCRLYCGILRSFYSLGSRSTTPPVFFLSAYIILEHSYLTLEFLYSISYSFRGQFQRFLSKDNFRDFCILFLWEILCDLCCMWRPCHFFCLQIAVTRIAQI